MAESAATANILGERGLRYKRNVLAASLVATVILWAGASLGDVSIFGVSLVHSEIENKEAVAWGVLFAILGYQWLMLTYYGLTDWRIWRKQIRDSYYLPVYPLFIGAKIGTEFKNNVGERFKITNRTKTGPRNDWSSKGIKHDGTLESQGFGGTFSDHDLGLVRRRLLAFLTIEFGLAFIWGLTCLGFVAGKIFLLILVHGR